MGSQHAGIAARMPGPWTAVTFQNSWVDFGGGVQTVQYRKIGDIVYVRGVMKSGASGTVAFTLPSGFRPPATIRSNGVSISNDPASATIATSGTVQIDDAATTTNVALDFSFSTTA